MSIGDSSVLIGGRDDRTLDSSFRKYNREDQRPVEQPKGEMKGAVEETKGEKEDTKGNDVNAESNR